MVKVLPICLSLMLVGSGISNILSVLVCARNVQLVEIASEIPYETYLSQFKESTSLCDTSGKSHPRNIFFFHVVEVLCGLR